MGAMKDELMNEYLTQHEKKHWMDIITRRGWIVIGIGIALAVLAFSHATRDVCWVGLDLVSCEALIAEVTK